MVVVIIIVKLLSRNKQDKSSNFKNGNLANERIQSMSKKFSRKLTPHLYKEVGYFYCQKLCFLFCFFSEKD